MGSFAVGDYLVVAAEASKLRIRQRLSYAAGVVTVVSKRSVKIAKPHDAHRPLH